MTPSAHLAEQLERMGIAASPSPDEWAFSDKIAPKANERADLDIAPPTPAPAAPSSPPSAPTDKRRPARKPSARKSKPARSKRASRTTPEPSDGTPPDDVVIHEPLAPVRAMPHAPGWSPETDADPALEPETDAPDAEDAATPESATTETPELEATLEPVVELAGAATPHPEPVATLEQDVDGDQTDADAHAMRPVTRKPRRARTRKPSRKPSQEDTPANETDDAVQTPAPQSDDDELDVTMLDEHEATTRRAPRRVLLAVLAVVLAAVTVFGVLRLVGNDPKPATPAPHVSQPDDVVAKYARGQGGVRGGDELGFRALFPSTPVRDTSMRAYANESVPFEFLSAGTDAVAFQVERVVLPSWMDVSLPNFVLRKAAEGIANARPGGTLTDYRDLTIDGDPGAAFKVSALHGVHVRGRVVLHGRTVYVIRVVSGSDSPSGFDRFVRSFRIL